MNQLFNFKKSALFWLVLFTVIFASAVMSFAKDSSVQTATNSINNPTYIPINDMLVSSLNFGDALVDAARERIYISSWFQYVTVANIDQAIVEKSLTNVYRPNKMGLNPDGSRLYVASDVVTEDGRITVIDTNTFNIVATHVYTNSIGTPYFNNIHSMAINSANVVYFAPSGDFSHHLVEVMDGTTGKILATIPLTNTVVSLALHDTKLFVVHASDTGNTELRRYDISGILPIFETSVPTRIGEAGELAFAPDGTFLLMRSRTGNVYQYDPQSLTETAAYIASSIYGFAWTSITPDSNAILNLFYPNGYYAPGGLYLFDQATHETIRQYEDQGDVSQAHAAFAFDNNRAAIVYDDRIRIFKEADYGVALPIILNKVCYSPIHDEFGDPGSGWPIADTGSVIYRYLQNEYNIFHRDKNQWAAATRGDQWIAGTQLVQIDGRVAAGTGIWGLLFGLNDDWSNFMTFEIQPENQTWAVYHYTSSNGWTLNASGSSSAIKSSGSNTLSLKDVSAQQLLINGVMVHSFYPAILGRVGVTGGSFSSNADFRYDNYIFSAEGCPLQPLSAANKVTEQIFTIPLPEK